MSWDDTDPMRDDQLWAHTIGAPPVAPATPDAAGLAERDAGAANALLSTHTSWRLSAEATLADLAARGVDFTAENVTAVCGDPPGHHNAVGGLFIAASKRGEIVAVGYRPASRREAHGRILRVWRGAS